MPLLYPDLRLDYKVATHPVQALTPQFETVNEGMQAQSTGAQQITEALAQFAVTPELGRLVRIRTIAST
jgi:hypothetical protein